MRNPLARHGARGQRAGDHEEGPPPGFVLSVVMAAPQGGRRRRRRRGSRARCPVSAAKIGLSSTGASVTRPASSAAASASQMPDTVLWPSPSTSGAVSVSNTDTGDATSGAPSGEWSAFVKNSPMRWPAANGAVAWMTFYYDPDGKGVTSA